MLKIKQKGNLRVTFDFLKRAEIQSHIHRLHHYGVQGVNALRLATPKDSGITSESWNYEIHSSGKSVSIIWTNNHMPGGIPVAILLQYGHATKNGFFIDGVDFINPALRPIFDDITNTVWREVTRG